MTAVDAEPPFRDKHERRAIVAELVAHASTFKQRATIPEDVEQKAPGVAAEAVEIMSEAMWAAVEHIVKEYGLS